MFHLLTPVAVRPYAYGGLLRLRSAVGGVLFSDSCRGINNLSGVIFFQYHGSFLPKPLTNQIKVAIILRQATEPRLAGHGFAALLSGEILKW